jgi:hypothetical protein
MNRFSVLLRRTATLAVATVGILAGVAMNGCGDDPVSPPAPTGSTKITVMHANAGFTSDVIFKDGDSTLQRVTYGSALYAQQKNGNRKVDVRATDGSVLTSQDLSLDSTLSVWVIFSGTSTKLESFKVSTKKSTPTGTNTLLRIVNASENLEPITVKIGDANGPALSTSATPYKTATDYVSVAPSTTTSLVILKTNNTPVLTVDVASRLLPGKSYTIVIYGSTANGATNVLTSKIVED